MNNLKTLITVTLLSFYLVGFSQSDVKTNLETYLQSELHDPSSYQFIELELIDTVRIYDELKVEFAQIKRIEDIDEKVERLGALKEKASVIGKDPSKNVPTSLLYNFSMRAKNAMGALVKSSYYLKVSLTNEIISMTKKN